MNKTILLTILLFCTSFIMYGQKSISGLLKDAGGETLIGASVIEVGTSNGTISDVDGSFQLTVAEDASIEVSFTGFTAQTLNVSGGNYFEVTLLEGELLQEVVVTALGIEREKSSLTFAQQSVDGGELTKARDINFLNALAGKAAGIQIKKSSGGPGGSTRVLLRGDKSLGGNSEPLFVIDGIPMANNKGSQAGMWGGNDGGDGMSQINPDDIESISVLKGSNAAALYGSQGANGVVLITTKKGEAGVTKVSISSGVTLESVLLKPELQFDYGSVGGTKESWSKTKNGSANRSYVDDFFNTGANIINSVSISGGTAKTQAFFSYGNVNASGIMPGNTYDRNTLTFKQSTKLFKDRLTVGSSVRLAQEDRMNTPAGGYYLNALTGLYLFPRDREMSVYQNNPGITDPNRNVDVMNWFVIDHHSNNPYWITGPGQELSNNTKRMIGSINLDYKINDKLSIATRGNLDYAHNITEGKYQSGGNTTNVAANGRWDYNNSSDELIYSDLLLKYNDNFGDFSLNFLGGTSYQKTTFGLGESVGTGTNGLLYANEFYFQNLPANVQVNSNLGSRLIKQAVFGNATLGYKDMIYADFSGRNDWASSLAGTSNESYFYPAVGLTAILSKIVDMPEAITFAKVRFSNTRVGNEVPFNRVNPQNTINGGGGVNRNTTQPFDNLSPEIITSTEFGTNWRFLNDRLGFDFTYYKTTSTDQFLSLPAPSGSGYTTYFVNAGEIVNKGIEIVFDVTPIYTRDFLWKSTFNFSRNRNEVVEIHPDLASINTGSSEGYGSRFEAGGSIGDVFVSMFKRDAQGRIELDPNSGKVQRTATQEFAGNLNPDWILGWGNNMDYKDFSLNFLINGAFGGVGFSQTEAFLDGFGASKRSGDDRDAGGTAINASLDGVQVNTIDPQTYYGDGGGTGGRNGIGEPYIYDRTNVRLTQMSLSYRTNLTPKIPITLSIVGQNLFFLYLEAPFDPELAINTSRNSQSLDSFTVPTTRTVGFNINVNF